MLLEQIKRRQILESTEAAPQWILEFQIQIVEGTTKGGGWWARVVNFGKGSKF